MPVLILDETLKIDDRYLRAYARDMDRLLRRVIKPENAARGWGASEKPAKEIVLRYSVSEDAPIRHSSYLEYLTQCYAVHYGIEINPDTFWYQTLTEIASTVKGAPDAFRDLFTDSNERKEIIVTTDEISALPLDKIIGELRKLVPSDTDAFLPVFSTTSPECYFAYSAAFADLCSPYYRYSTMLCGYPKIRIKGTKEDYDSLESHIAKLLEIFKGKLIVPAYLEKVRLCVIKFRAAFETGNLEYLSNILTTKSCGSGGEVKCDGWWVTDMYVKDMSDTKPENFPSGISRVEYKNLETKRNFSVNVGLFHSNLDEEGIAVPDWAFVVTEILESKVPV